MLDAIDVMSSLFPKQNLRKTAEEFPFMHSRLTELQVHTLLSISFDSHEIWTRDEIREHLSSVADKLNHQSVGIFSNALSEDEYFNHYKGVPGYETETVKE